MEKQAIFTIDRDAKFHAIWTQEHGVEIFGISGDNEFVRGLKSAVRLLLDDMPAKQVFLKMESNDAEFMIEVAA